MTQDLARLNEGVKALSAGAYDYPLANKRRDEIGQLTTSMQKCQKTYKPMKIKEGPLYPISPMILGRL